MKHSHHATNLNQAKIHKKKQHPNFTFKKIQPEKPRKNKKRRKKPEHSKTNRQTNHIRELCLIPINQIQQLLLNYKSNTSQCNQNECS